MYLKRNSSLAQQHPAVLAILDENKQGKRTFRRPKWTIRVIRATSNFFIALILVGFGLIINILQIIVSPVIIFSPLLNHRLNSLFACFAWTLCQLLLEGFDDVCRITVSGLDSVPGSESAIVISNHVYFGDFFLVHFLARRKYMMSYCRYFLKDSIKYLPIFGWGMYLINMPFLKRDWQRDNRRIRQSLDSLIRNRLPVWLVSFVEGHRINPDKIVKSQKYATCIPGAPHLEHVLLPRSKGLTATLRAFRGAPGGSQVHSVYDLTLAYNHRTRGPSSVPSLFEIITGALEGYEMHLHVNRIPIEDIPTEDSEITTWLYNLYADKDMLIKDIKTAFLKRNSLI